MRVMRCVSAVYVGLQHLKPCLDGIVLLLINSVWTMDEAARVQGERCTAHGPQKAGRLPIGPINAEAKGGPHVCVSPLWAILLPSTFRLLTNDTLAIEAARRFRRAFRGLSRRANRSSGFVRIHQLLRWSQS